MEITSTNPVEELRKAAGAAGGSTGSEIMASGGSPIAGAISITGSGNSGSAGPTQGTVRRLVSSGATDAVSDIVSKMQGNGDPNPGHTTDAESNSPVNRATNAAENAAQSAVNAVGGGGTLRGKLVAGALAVAAGVVALAGFAAVED